MATALTRHLDLGCGEVPRNPYRRQQLFGIDIAPRGTPEGGHVVKAGNLALQPIPFEDSSFDSVSAYELFEHIPRVLPTADGSATRLPFVELMNEVSRVLRPGGLLYAITPCYPSREAFQDPTHVNIITERTHVYFTGDAPLGRMYGFTGHFHVERVEWVVFNDALMADTRLGLHQRLRRLNYRRKGQLAHLLWEFRCTKPAG